jgi:hypothetical protein
LPRADRRKIEDRKRAYSTSFADRPAQVNTVIREWLAELRSSFEAAYQTDRACVLRLQRAAAP